MRKEREQHIIRLLHQKDKQAISILYDEYAPTLYGIALRIVHSEATAQDVIQEAFVKAWKKGDSYDAGKGTLFTWLLNICRNTAIDKTRSAAFRQSAMIQSLDTNVYNNEQHSQEINTDQIGLRKMVGALEEKYRMVIELSFFQGYTHQEVSDHLGIPLGTVKSRIRIALRSLRRIFEEYSMIILWITTLCWAYLI